MCACWLAAGPDGPVRVAGMTPIAASTVQAMAGIFHPFVSLCFQCIFLPGHIASCLDGNLVTSSLNPALVNHI